MANVVFHRIKNILPEFVRGPEFNTFVKFLEAYYCFMESNEEYGAIGYARKLPQFSDIDDLDEEFLENLLEEYAEGVNRERVSDIRFFIKNFKVFLANKGNENSYKFLFRMLYGSNATLYYPKENVLRVSGGHWRTFSFLRFRGDLSDRVQAGMMILGVASNATAVVGAVNVRRLETHTITDVVLEKNVRPFALGENINLGNAIIKSEEQIITIRISDAGTGYENNEEVSVTYDTDTDALLRGRLGVDSDGAIQNVVIDDPGLVPASVTLSVSIDDTSGTGAVLEAVRGAVFNSAGHYENTEGLLLPENKLQDSNFYQDFSYVVRTEVALSEYERAVNRLVHPAGTKLFGSVVLDDVVRHSDLGRILPDPVVLLLPRLNYIVYLPVVRPEEVAQIAEPVDENGNPDTSSADYQGYLDYQQYLRELSFYNNNKDIVFDVQDQFLDSIGDMTFEDLEDVLLRRRTYSSYPVQDFVEISST